MNSCENCIDNRPRIGRLAGVTRTLRLAIYEGEGIPVGTPQDLSGLTVAVQILRDGTNDVFVPEFAISGDDNNVIEFVWPAERQAVGNYTIQVTTADGSGNINRVNWHGPTGIRLVEYSYQVYGDDATGEASSESVGLIGYYTTSGVGMSAYDEWLSSPESDGWPQTVSGFLAYLKQPATEAAEALGQVVSEKMAEVDEKMDSVQGRADADHTRAGNDHTTAGQDHTRAGNDHTTATDDHRIAAADHSTATDDHTLAASDHATAEADHTQASSDHTTAEADHGIAASDHTAAAADHTQAGNDHSRAESDHTTAASDHSQAGTDHTRAEGDHATAGQDHTQAGSDHTTAAGDHTTAAADHTQAVADHAVMAGYDTRLGNVEGEVSQLGQKVNEFTNADFPLYDGWMSNNNGSYAYGADRAFSVIPVREGVFYEITAKDAPCQLCFLKSFDGIPTTSFDTAASRMLLATVGAKNSGVVPYGSNYIYVLRKYNGTEIALPEILINGVDVASAVINQVSELARENMAFHNDAREALTIYTGWMSANDGTYSAIHSNGFYVIPIKEGVPYEIEATATPCHLAFLNSFDGVPSSAFDINGTRLLLSSVGAKASGVVPTGAKYLYILARYTNTDISLPKIRVGEIDVLDDIYRQLYALAEWTSWSKKVGLSGEHTQELLASEANAYYINTNYTPAVLVASSGDFRLSNPIYLRSGDKVKVVSPAMGFSAGKAVLAKTNTSVFSPTKMYIQAIDIAPTGSGYDTTYDYTVTEAGYYVVGWATQYSSSHAYIIFAETDKIAKNTEDIGINARKIFNLEELSIGPIVNVFGDILPKNFRDKFFGSVEDVEVVCVGDSLTGLVQYSGILDNPEHQAPGMLYEHWTYQLWDRLCLNKPVCDRLDSQRDGVDVFTKVGTWSEYVNNTSGNYGDYSITADTYKSNSADASVSFVLNLDDYEKCNIVFSANPDGALAEIVLTEGNGKLLASLDKSTWVEANGFQVNEGTEDLRERHRRVWMKRAIGATGEVTVTFKRSSTDPGSSHYLYCWGTERWNGASFFLTNLGRGGRNMIILGENRMDIFDRKPDLCIFELPLANETVVGAYTLTSLKQVYSDNLTYLRTLSNDFQDTEFLFVLPTGRTQYFDGNQAVEYVSSGTATMKNHLMAKAIFGYVAELTKNYRDNVGMVNLADQVYNEGLVRGYTLQGWLAPSSIDIPTITYDGVHLRNLGSTFWAKYLAGIFQ